MTDKEIIIDGEKYNPCNGCKLWDGGYCTADRSYETNADTHRIICNEHLAKEFQKTYKQLARKTQECEELHTELKFKVEYIQEQREVIKDLEKKLKISIQALEELEMTENNFNFTNQDEYFKGLDTELAKKSIRLTIENRKLENKLSDIAGICEQILDGEDYVRRIAKTILDIID